MEVTFQGGIAYAGFPGGLSPGYLVIVEQMNSRLDAFELEALKRIRYFKSRRNRLDEPASWYPEGLLFAYKDKRWRGIAGPNPSSYLYVAFRLFYPEVAVGF